MHPLHTVACWLTIAAVGRLPLTTSTPDMTPDMTPVPYNKPPSLSELAGEYHKKHTKKNGSSEFPEEKLLRNFDSLCSEAINYRFMQPHLAPDVGHMNIKLMVSNYTVDLKDAHWLWQGEEFNRFYPTVVLVTGWLQADEETNPALTDLYRAYQCRGSWNFVVSCCVMFDKLQ